MPKCKDVAAALRNLADHLDAAPEQDIVRPFINLSHSFEPKEKFIALAKLLPRPLKKEYHYGDMQLIGESANLYVYATINRDKLCRLVSPAQDAVYECEAILSQDEDAALIGA